MKKILLSIFMLIAMSIQSQTLEETLPGIYSNDKTDHYVVILHNKNHELHNDEEWIVFSFSLNSGTFKKSTIVEKDFNSLKTNLSFKPKWNYEIDETWKIVGKNVYVKFEGDYNDTQLYNKYILKELIKN